MSTASGDASTAILQATLRAIASAGVDGVRYREIAREAGVSLGTVSYNFATRHDLIQGAFELFLEESRAALAAIQARLPSETLDELAELLTAFARAYRADRPRCMAEFELMVYAARDAGLAESLTTWDRARQVELAVVLERLGVLRPTAAAQVLIDTIRGFQVSNLGVEKPDLDGLQERIRDLLRVLAQPSAS